MRFNLMIAGTALATLLASSPAWITAAGPQSRTMPSREPVFPSLAPLGEDEIADTLIIAAEVDEQAPARGDSTENDGDEEEDSSATPQDPAVPKPDGASEAASSETDDAADTTPAAEATGDKDKGNSGDAETDPEGAADADENPESGDLGADESSELPPLTPRMMRLRNRVRSTLAYYHTKRLNTRDHNPWEVMHSIVAYGAASYLSRNGADGPPVNSISWLCWNGPCHGTPILEVVGGNVAARKGPQVQGHPGQFLAILAQGSIATTCPIKVGNQRFTLVDLIESEKLGCEAGTELTFKLISFSYYLDVEEHWNNSRGEDWSIDRLIHEEMAQPIVGAPCGGTHRLMGLAYAVRKRETSGLPITGEFRRAKKYLDDYHRYTLTRLQNSDGSFSTEWFKAPGARPDLGRRIQTSGHILEWLSYSLPEESLRDYRVVRAVEYLSGVLAENKDKEWEIGPLGHALHSLAIYDSRVFKPYDELQTDNGAVANRGSRSHLPAASAGRGAANRATQPAVKAANPRVARPDARSQQMRSKSVPTTKR